LTRKLIGRVAGIEGASTARGDVNPTADPLFRFGDWTGFRG